ncbi:Bax inhibitor-1/YccA family protein [Faecalicoccus acidiformans]|uniref:Bax inhibitor-1/YccA family protein n=1 Tax=Faecalicoccus acidiformans TaxID=915173 RepID=A0ABS2FQA3_9FIRM|nr:Bax inhibitor-1/YccA family protein [Faecalicoccus acidiformans]MBM6831535.1 Bax inhibitor-1/YccA family protein [Faecalicoccus acidiformans]
MFNDYQTTFYSQDTVRKSVLNSYVWMALGLLVTGAVSFGLYVTGLFFTLLASPFVMLALIIAQFGIVIAFSSALARNTSAGTMKILFLAYAIILGITMTSIFYSYPLGVIGVAFFVSALFFGCLVIMGITTKKDMTRIGMICMAGLFAMIISQPILWLLGFGLMTRMFSLLGLVIFAGLTIWDVQRMHKIMTLEDGTIVSREKLSIYFALELYLDFINIFLYILRLVGLGSSRD